MRLSKFKFFRKLIGNQSGVALVELAFVAPMMAMMAVGTIDYSLLVMSKLSVEGAARDGAAYAVNHGYSSSSIANVVTSAGRSASYLSAVTADPAPTRWYGCANANSGVVVTTNATDVCANGQTAGTYVTVSARGTYTYLVPWPTFGSTYSIVARVKTRIS